MPHSAIWGQFFVLKLKLVQDSRCFKMYMCIEFCFSVGLSVIPFQVTRNTLCMPIITENAHPYSYFFIFPSITYFLLWCKINDFHKYHNITYLKL